MGDMPSDARGGARSFERRGATREAGRGRSRGGAPQRGARRVVWHLSYPIERSRPICTEHSTFVVDPCNPSCTKFPRKSDRPRKWCVSALWDWWCPRETPPRLRFMIRKDLLPGIARWRWSRGQRRWPGCRGAVVHTASARVRPSTAALAVAYGRAPAHGWLGLVRGDVDDRPVGPGGQEPAHAGHPWPAAAGGAAATGDGGGAGDGGGSGWPPRSAWPTAASAATASRRASRAL
jgi:hypothetical protein